MFQDTFNSKLKFKLLSLALCPFALWKMEFLYNIFGDILTIQMAQTFFKATLYCNILLIKRKKSEVNF